MDSSINAEAESNGATVENVPRPAVTWLRDPSWGLYFLKRCQVVELWLPSALGPVE
jgi:hypothetical protein